MESFKFVIMDISKHDGHELYSASDNVAATVIE